MRRGAIILCGGRSNRMGVPKLALPFGAETMLQRVLRLTREAVEPVAVVAAPSQELPELGEGVAIARDRTEGQGPLEGMAVGMRALAGSCDAVYVTSCDVPLLVPAFVERMFALLGEHQVAVPVDGKFHHPLSAVYRLSVLPTVEKLIAENRMRPYFLFQEVNTREVPVEELREADAELSTLRNLNHPDDYLTALRDAGIEPREDILRALGRANGKRG